MSSELAQIYDIGELVDVTQGLAINSKTKHLLRDEGLPLLRITDLFSGSYSQFVTQEGVPKQCIANSEELIYTRTGQVGFVFTNKVGVVHNNCFKVTPKDDRLSRRYLYWYLRQESVRSYVNTVASGSVQKDLNHSAFKTLKIPLLDLEAQRQIDSILSSLDDRITLLRETNATLEAIAQALFKSWFVDFDPVRAKMEGRTPEGMDEATAALFPDGFETSELGEVPRGWRWGTLSDLATFQNGYAFKSKDWTDSGHPVVKIGDVKPGIIDLEGCSYVAHETVVGLDRFRLSRGDLLVGMTGYVGATGLVPSVEPAAYLNQRVGRMATKSGVTDLGYLYCAARSPAFKEFAEAQSHGSAQANVSGASLMAFPAVIAPLPLMERFNGAIADVLEVVLTNHEQAQTLSTLRDTLLPHLISGQLRLPETENLIKALIF